MRHRRDRTAAAMLAVLLAGLCPLAVAGAATPPRPDSPDSIPSCLRFEDRTSEEDLDGILDTQHFRIHYARSGPDRIPSWPDSSILDSLGIWFERAWHRYHVEMGLRVPPGDGSRGGGRNLVDCYVEDVHGGSGWARWLWPDSTFFEDCPWAGGGEMRLSIFSLRPDQARPLTAHEYFHLVQYGYASGDDWLDESTAVWAERQVWPDGEGLFGDTGCWFGTPFLRLWDGNGNCRLYGGVAFWLCLEQQTDTTIVPRVLARCCQEQAIGALQGELAARGRDLDSCLVEFALWNNATGPRDDGRHYRRGDLLPEVSVQAEYASLPVTGDSLPSSLLARNAGSNYIRFIGPGRRDTLHVRFNGQAELRSLRRVSLVTTFPAMRRVETTLAPDAQGDCAFDVPDWSSCLDATLIVTNFVQAPVQHRQFTWSAWETGRRSRQRILALAPNPCRQGTSLWFLVEGDDFYRLSIHDALGRRICLAGEGWVRAGTHQLQWNGRDGNGRVLPPGVYFMCLETSGWSTGRKVLVVR